VGQFAAAVEDFAVGERGHKPAQAPVDDKSPALVAQLAESEV